MLCLCDRFVALIDIRMYLFPFLFFSTGPQLVLSIYGTDIFGNEVVMGYTACHLPLAPGKHTRKLVESHSVVPVSDEIRLQYI